MAKHPINQQLRYGTIIKTNPFADIKLPHHREIAQKVNAKDINQRFNRVENMLKELQKLSEQIQDTQGSLNQQQEHQNFNIQQLENQLTQQKESGGNNHLKLCSILEVLNQDIQGLKENMSSMQNSLEQMESQWDQWESFIKDQENNLKQQLLQDSEAVDQTLEPNSAALEPETVTPEPETAEMKNAGDLPENLPEDLAKTLAEAYSHIDISHSDLIETTLDTDEPKFIEASKIGDDSEHQTGSPEQVDAEQDKDESEMENLLQLEEEIQRELEHLEHCQHPLPSQAITNHPESLDTQNLQVSSGLKPEINTFDGWVNSDIEQSMLGLDTSQLSMPDDEFGGEFQADDPASDQQPLLEQGTDALALEEIGPDSDAKQAPLPNDQLEETEETQTPKAEDDSAELTSQTAESELPEEPDHDIDVASSETSDQELTGDKNDSSDFVKLDNDPNEMEIGLLQLMDDMELSINTEAIDFITDEQFPETPRDISDTVSDILVDWQKSVGLEELEIIEEAEETKEDSPLQLVNLDYPNSPETSENFQLPEDTLSEQIDLSQSDAEQLPGNDVAQQDLLSNAFTAQAAESDSDIAPDTEQENDSNSSSVIVEFQEYPEDISSQLADFDIELQAEDEFPLISDAVTAGAAWEGEPESSLEDDDQPITFSQLPDDLHMNSHTPDNLSGSSLQDTSELPKRSETDKDEPEPQQPETDPEELEPSEQEQTEDLSEHMAYVAMLERLEREGPAAAQNSKTPLQPVETETQDKTEELLRQFCNDIEESRSSAEQDANDSHQNKAETACDSDTELADNIDNENWSNENWDNKSDSEPEDMVPERMAYVELLEKLEREHTEGQGSETRNEPQKHLLHDDTEESESKPEFEAEDTVPERMAYVELLEKIEREKDEQDSELSQADSETITSHSEDPADATQNSTKHYDSTSDLVQSDYIALLNSLPIAGSKDLSNTINSQILQESSSQEFDDITLEDTEAYTEAESGISSQTNSTDDEQTGDDSEMENILSRIAEENRQTMHFDEEDDLSAEIIEALAEATSDPQQTQQTDELQEEFSSHTKDTHSVDLETQLETSVSTDTNRVSSTQEPDQQGKASSLMLNNKQNLTDQALEILENLPVANTLGNLDEQLSSEISQLLTELSHKDNLQLVASQRQELQVRGVNHEQDPEQNKGDLQLQNRIELPDDPFELPDVNTSIYSTRITSPANKPTATPPAPQDQNSEHPSDSAQIKTDFNSQPLNTIHGQITNDLENSGITEIMSPVVLSEFDSGTSLSQPDVKGELHSSGIAQTEDILADFDEPGLSEMLQDQTFSEVSSQQILMDQDPVFLLDDPEDSPQIRKDKENLDEFLDKTLGKNQEEIPEVHNIEADAQDNSPTPFTTSETSDPATDETDSLNFDLVQELKAVISHSNSQQLDNTASSQTTSSLVDSEATEIISSAVLSEFDSDASISQPDMEGELHSSEIAQTEDVLAGFDELGSSPELNEALQNQTFSEVSSQQILVDRDPIILLDDSEDGPQIRKNKESLDKFLDGTLNKALGKAQSETLNKSQNRALDKNQEEIPEVRNIEADEGIPVLNINLSALTSNNQDNWKEFLLDDNEEFETLLDEER